MRILYLWMVLLLLAGCGQKLEQSQMLTAAPEQSEPEPPPDRSFLVSNGQISSLVFTPGGGYNGMNPPVSTTSAVSGNLNIDSEANNSLNLNLTEGARTLHFGVVSGPDALVTGQLYDLAQGASVALQDLTGGTLTWQQTALSSGGLTIVSLSDTSIEVDFHFAQVQPLLGEGTFDVSGHLTADLTPL